MTRPGILRGLGFVALWLLIGLGLSAEVYFNVRVSNPEIRFAEVAGAQFYRALLWAVMVPGVVWLKDAVPLDRGRWVGGIGFHLGMSFAVMAAYYLARITLSMLSAGESFEGFWEVAATNFYGRNLIDMAFYWAVIGVVYAVRIREKYQRESLRTAQLEAKLVEAELRVLKNQLNPHFLFNTLNTVAVLVREGRNDSAVQLIARLSSLLRMTLENTRVQTVTLRQELDFLTRYLEIQQARFGDRLQYHADAEAAALDAVIPNLILQPVVENAILHGIAPKAAPGRVEIDARVRAGRLEIEVRDDGPGFPSDRGPAKSPGIGLANTRDRLERLYGTDFQMVLRSARGRGVTVSFVLPFHRSTLNPAQP